MKNIREVVRDEIAPSEYSRIPHTVCLADFNTSHPNSSRIDRIANEINEYIKWKRKSVKV